MVEEGAVAVELAMEEGQAEEAEEPGMSWHMVSRLERQQQHLLMLNLDPLH